MRTPRVSLSNFKSSASDERGATGVGESSGIFSQAFSALGSQPAAAWRVASPHTRPFEVAFEGETGIDQGGVYREALQRVVEDLFSDKFSLLRRVGAGGGGLFVPNAALRGSPLAADMLAFVGRLVGLSIRTRASLAFGFARVVWRALAGARPALLADGAAWRDADAAAAAPVAAAYLVRLLAWRAPVFAEPAAAAATFDADFSAEAGAGADAPPLPPDLFAPSALAAARKAGLTAAVVRASPAARARLVALAEADILRGIAPGCDAIRAGLGAIIPLGEGGDCGVLRIRRGI